MELAFRTQFDPSRRAFTLHFDPQAFFALAPAGSPRLGVQAYFRRNLAEGAPAPTLFPILLELHGALRRQAGLDDRGMPLLPVRALTVYLLPSSSETLVNLAFEAPLHYLDVLEEERARSPAQDVVLALELWGVAAMVHASPRETVPVQIPPEVREIVRFEGFETEYPPGAIRFERSAWIDRILPGLGYRQSMLIEIPLVKTPPFPQAYQQAGEALSLAYSAFAQQDYRGALRYVRDVLECLSSLSSDGSGRLVSFCKEYLEPCAGETKAGAVDTALAQEIPGGLRPGFGGRGERRQRRGELMPQAGETLGISHQ